MLKFWVLVIMFFGKCLNTKTSHLIEVFFVEMSGHLWQRLKWFLASCDGGRCLGRADQLYSTESLFPSCRRWDWFEWQWLRTARALSERPWIFTAKGCSISCPSCKMKRIWNIGGLYKPRYQLLSKNNYLKKKDSVATNGSWWFLISNAAPLTSSLTHLFLLCTRWANTSKELKSSSLHSSLGRLFSQRTREVAMNSVSGSIS